jgi:hypothetical protein
MASPRPSPGHVPPAMTSMGQNIRPFILAPMTVRKRHRPEAVIVRRRLTQRACSVERLLPSGAEEASISNMVEPVSIASYRDDTLWAVVASIGRTSRVAEVFTSRLAALADQAWREQQVNDYANFLRSSLQPTPCYTVRPIRRADLPRSWRPLPALGFLHGKLL